MLASVLSLKNARQHGTVQDPAVNALVRVTVPAELQVAIPAMMSLAGSSIAPRNRYSRGCTAAVRSQRQSGAMVTS